MIIKFHVSISGTPVDVFNDGDAWDMVFRGTPGVGESAYDYYMNPQPGCFPRECLDVRFRFDLEKGVGAGLLYYFFI